MAYDISLQALGIPLDRYGKNFGEFNAGNSGATKTIDFANGPAQLLTLTADCVLTLANAKAGHAYILRIIGAFTITWPSTKWASADGDPTLTGTCLVNLYYDGTYFYGSYKLDYV